MAAHNDTVLVRALNGVSLDLQRGDRLGVIGHNGAGKTTLLRVISRVYPPTVGEAMIEGKISSFTDITLGMESEATGWQNIIFRCVFLGLTFSEAKTLAPSIGEFSELHEYLDLPVRTYSTGMFLRLAFAISTAVQPEIIVMDELIGAGDQGFIKKAHRRLTELIEGAGILVLASHSVKLITDFCDKAVWLEKGEVRMFGSAQEVVDAYSEGPSVAG